MHRPTEEQQLLKQAMREFAVGEIAPGASERDELARFPSELIPKLAEQGLLGIMVPEEYGGAGYDAASAAVILEEIARVDAAVALLVGSHNSLCSGHILLAGNAEQKRKYLPPLARGEKLGAWALTEPGSGSDAGAMRTRATLEGDVWVIRGDKQFITQGSTAGTYVIMASTDPGQGTKGISAFIVERETPGLAVGKLEKKLGVRASDTAALHFDDMRVPKENLLGRQNEGFKDVLSVLTAARIGMAALAVGIAQGALDEALAYAKRRRQFGKPILEYEAIQWMLADMALKARPRECSRGTPPTCAIAASRISALRRRQSCTLLKWRSAPPRKPSRFTEVTDISKTLRSSGFTATPSCARLVREHPRCNGW